MTIVILQLPDVKGEAEGRPSRRIEDSTWSIGKTQPLPELHRGDLSALGRVYPTHSRSACPGSGGVSLPVLPMWAHLPAISAGSDAGAAEPAAVQAGSFDVGIGIELPRDRRLAGGISGADRTGDRLAGCARLGRAVVSKTSMAAGTGVRDRWGVCAWVGRHSPGDGGGGPGSRATGGGRLWG